MSAVNVFVSSRRACMLTDSSIYDASGTIIAFANKAYEIDSWTGAITGRGNWWGPTFVRDLAETFGSFDEFLTLSPAAIEKAHHAALDGGQLAGQTLIEVHAIGWSELRDRAEAYVLKSPSEFVDEDEVPYSWVNLDQEDGSFIHALFNAGELWELHRRGAEPDVDFTPETFDPIQHGIPVMEAQRRRPASAMAGDHVAGKYVIGGDLWLTVVDREGVRQGVIHSWPDEEGQPIQPVPVDQTTLSKIPPSGFHTAWTFSRFDAAVRGGAINLKTFELDKARLAQIEAVAPPGAGLNRKQRLAAKAQAKKGVRAHV